MLLLILSFVQVMGMCGLGSAGLLASASLDTNIIVWDVARGQEVRTREADTGAAGRCVYKYKSTSQPKLQYFHA